MIYRGYIDILAKVQGVVSTVTMLHKGNCAREYDKVINIIFIAQNIHSNYRDVDWNDDRISITGSKVLNRSLLMLKYPRIETHSKRKS